MRVVLGPVVAALVLFGVGAAFWRAGQLERRVADAHEELALLHYGGLADEYSDIEESMGYARRVPWVTNGLLTEVREHRAAAEYWQSRYETLAQPKDSSGTPVEQEPALAFLSANATYRTSQQDLTDRQATLRGLDSALKSYTEVLKKSAGNVDAAYNYELIVRQRDVIAKTRPTPPPKKGLVEPPVVDVAASDLPAGRTVHGRPGAPPPSTDMSQFKMHIPVRPDERKGGDEAGQGKEKIRKG